MIEIFGVAGTRTRRCLWTAEECGTEYTQHPVSPYKGQHRDPQFLALNPNARVPAMRDGDLVLFESAAICRYIAEHHPEAGLLPEPRSPEAARHEQWMHWVGGEIDQALWTLGKHRFALPEEYRVAEMERVGRFEYDRAAKVLADHMDGQAEKGHDFLLGNHFRLVDIFVGHTLNWARNFKVPLGGAVLELYLDRLIARPAFQKTLEMP